MFAPKRGVIYYYMIGAILSLAFLYFNDFSLNELHETSSSTIAGAIRGSMNDSSK